VQTAARKKNNKTIFTTFQKFRSNGNGTRRGQVCNIAMPLPHSRGMSQFKSQKNNMLLHMAAATNNTYTPKASSRDLANRVRDCHDLLQLH
jgi:hypothetical protein